MRLTMVCLTSLFSAALYAQSPGIVLDPSKSRNSWEGWGTSLAWWGVGVGASAYQEPLADLIFTQKTVNIRGQDYPGLGLNVVRYNVGGGGLPGDVPEQAEKRPSDLVWYRDVDGYWVDWYSTDPTSTSWNWDRDVNQRALLQAAVARGVDKVEFFANAPMWWMMNSKSSAGGRLQSWNRLDFARYLATVAKKAQTDWKIPVTSIEPFNEPSANWWNYPKNQEGCGIPLSEQVEIMRNLEGELQSRGLGSLQLTAGDENSVREAKTATEYYDKNNVGGLLEKINVHAYSNGLSPMRDNKARTALTQAAKGRTIWVSEYGDPDGTGADLAQTIIEDLSYLRPTAWVYWQIIENSSAWGALNANFDQTGERRAEPTWVYNKYWIFAHFTRFIRPGNLILEQSEPSLTVGFDPHSETYAGVLVNRGAARTLTLKVPKAGAAQLRRTAFNGSKVWQSEIIETVGGELTLKAGAGEILSFVL